MPRAELTRWDQATLLQRVWGVDALTCEGCGGRRRFIAVIFGPRSELQSL